MRKQLKNALLERLNEHLPEALGSAWGTTDVQLFIEESTLLPISMDEPADETWEVVTGFTATAVAELISQEIDDLNTDKLWHSLHTKPLQVPLPEAAEVNDVARFVNATFIGERDYLDDMKCVTTLRFSLSGFLCEKLAACPAVTEVHLGKAPNIGDEHVEDYAQIAGETA